MSRTAQQTNDVMKILTITSVLLLPTGVIAGFMGMNIKAPYSNDDPTIFWIVLAGWFRSRRTPSASLRTTIRWEERRGRLSVPCGSSG